MKRAAVMTVYQRPFYLKPVLDAWEKVRGVENWPFIFMVEETATADAMISIIEAFDHPNKTIIRNEGKLGVLRNPHAGLSRAFDAGYDFVALIEEDLLPASSIIEYFEMGSKICERNRQILAVCAQGEDKGDPYGIETRESFKVWLWGTWRDRWEGIIRDTWDLDYSTGSGFDSGWDWNLDIRILPKLGMSCLFPKQPLVDNLGQWLGVHAHPDHYEESRPKGFVQDVPASTCWSISEPLIIDSGTQKAGSL